MKTLPQLTEGITPLPWRINYDTAEKDSEILSDSDSGAIRDWKAKNPDKRTGFGAPTEITKLRVFFNGSGPKHGPDKLIGDIEVKRNAAYIVLACNSLPKLAEALENAISPLERSVCGDSNVSHQVACQRALENARAALKEVSGS
jgi:hypothetical protein